MKSIFGPTIGERWPSSNWQENLGCDSLYSRLEPKWKWNAKKKKKKKRVIVYFRDHQKLGTAFTSWQSGCFGVYSDQHSNQHPGILDLAFQSTQAHTISLCADASVGGHLCLKPVRKVGRHLFRVLRRKKTNNLWFGGVILLWDYSMFRLQWGFSVKTDHAE